MCVCMLWLRLFYTLFWPIEYTQSVGCVSDHALLGVNWHVDDWKLAILQSFPSSMDSNIYINKSSSTLLFKVRVSIVATGLFTIRSSSAFMRFSSIFNNIRYLQRNWMHAKFIQWSSKHDKLLWCYFSLEIVTMWCVESGWAHGWYQYFGSYYIFIFSIIL